MMDVTYFKEHIHEELDGARDYIEKAIESKISHPAWVMQFVKMADMEADHAGTLMKMLETCIRNKPATNPNPLDPSSSPETVYKDLMKAFGETMTYVTNMKRGL